MPQLIKPSTKVQIVPRDGELEITLNINITVDGQIQATADNAQVSVLSKKEEPEAEDKSPHFIPQFGSGMKLSFGKKD